MWRGLLEWLLTKLQIVVHVELICESRRNLKTKVYSTIRPTIHTKMLRKRNFSKTFSNRDVRTHMHACIHTYKHACMYACMYLRPGIHMKMYCTYIGPVPYMRRACFDEFNYHDSRKARLTEGILAGIQSIQSWASVLFLLQAATSTLNNGSSG